MRLPQYNITAGLFLGAGQLALVNNRVISFTPSLYIMALSIIVGEMKLRSARPLSCALGLQAAAAKRFDGASSNAYNKPETEVVEQHY